MKFHHSIFAIMLVLTATLSQEPAMSAQTIMTKPFVCISFKIRMEPKSPSPTTAPRSWRSKFRTVTANWRMSFWDTIHCRDMKRAGPILAD